MYLLGINVFSCCSHSSGLSPSIHKEYIHSSAQCFVLPAEHKHSPSLLLSGSSAREPGADPHSISNSTFHRLFFSRNCRARGTLSTYLFLSGCRLISEFAHYVHGHVCCHRRSKGHRTVPICFACVPLASISHSM